MTTQWRKIVSLTNGDEEWTDTHKRMKLIHSFTLTSSTQKHSLMAPWIKRYKTCKNKIQRRKLWSFGTNNRDVFDNLTPVAKGN